MTTYYKYPRTYHLPFSPGTTNEDRILSSTEHLKNMMVVITEKLDGGNFSLYPDYIHARSINSRYHLSESIIREIHATIKNDIPYGYRICVENCYAKHSCFYDKLISFVYIISVWNDKNVCLSWDETKKWAELLGLEVVPELYVGIYDEEQIKRCWTGISKFGNEQEGYVGRNINAFHYDDFSENTFKYVRKGHVVSGEHWRKNWIPNKLKE